MGIPVPSPFLQVAWAFGKKAIETYSRKKEKGEKKQELTWAMEGGTAGEFGETAAVRVQGREETERVFYVLLCYEKDPLYHSSKATSNELLCESLPLFPNVTLHRHWDMKHHHLYVGDK